MNSKLTETLKNVKKDSASDYVFANGDGNPYRDIKTGWWNAIRKAGLQGLRFHDLRHTFASRLVMAGVDLVTVKELMGHKDIKMTMRYSHPTPEHKKAAVEILDEVTTNLTTQPESTDLHFAKIHNR
jgi:integrase